MALLLGATPGGVEYSGQYEDDIPDLIRELRRQGHIDLIILGGHSTGAGFVLWLSGGLGSQRQAIAGYIALDPITPRSTAVRGGTAGGWNVIDLRRILGLGARNAIGVHGFDGLPVIAFTKPASAGNGTESLVCSWRLTAFYHPHNEHARDVRAMRASALILFGDKDEAADGAARGSGQGRGSSARQLTAPVGQSR